VSLVWAHTRAGVLELLRYPSFSVPTLLLPAAALLLFGARRSPAPPNVLLASYAALALLGVAFFQFGVGIAAERISPWHAFLRTLPAPPLVRFAARIGAALVFGLGAAAGVVAVAVVTTPVSLPPSRWLLLAVVLLGGSVPSALLGIALGYWLTPRGALPLANLLYLGLSYVGGLWTLSRHLPPLLAPIAPIVPTRLWGSLLAAAVGAAPWHPRDVALLAAWGALFAVLALWGFRRDEGQRFR
jgi:ABC-2 type transport system permease protein